MNRRTLLASTTTVLLAGCSNLVNTEKEDRPEDYFLAEILVINKHAASSHDVAITVVADDERVYEGTVELAPEGELENSEEISCEFGEVTTPFEVRAALPNGTEGTIDATVEDLNYKRQNLQARMKVRNSGDIDASFFPIEEHKVPDCEPTPTT